MAKKEKSAGIILYRKKPELKILLVHPSGSYNRTAPWSIPKGKIESGESLEETAKREIFEEVGIKIDGNLPSLDKVVYKSGKQVYAFYTEISESASPVLNWENDEFRFCSLDEARDIIMPAQKPFIDRFAEALKIGAANVS